MSLPGNKRHLFSGFGAFTKFIFNSSKNADDEDKQQDECEEDDLRPSTTPDITTDTHYSTSRFDDSQISSEESCDIPLFCSDSSSSPGPEMHNIGSGNDQSETNIDITQDALMTEIKPCFVRLKRLKFAFEKPEAKTLMIKDDILLLSPSETEDQFTDGEDEELERNSEELKTSKEISCIKKNTCCDSDEESEISIYLHDTGTRNDTSETVSNRANSCDSSSTSSDISNYVPSSTPLRLTNDINDTGNQLRPTMIASDTADSVPQDNDSSSESDSNNSSPKENDPEKDVLEQNDSNNSDMRKESLTNNSTQHKHGSEEPIKEAGQLIQTQELMTVDKSLIRIVKDGRTLTWADFEKQYGFGEVEILSLLPVDTIPSNDRNLDQANGIKRNFTKVVDSQTNSHQIGIDCVHQGTKEGQTTQDFLEAITTNPLCGTPLFLKSDKLTKTANYHSYPTKDGKDIDIDHIIMKEIEDLPVDIVCKNGTGRGLNAKYEVRLSSGKLDIWKSVDIKALAPAVFKEYQRKLAVDSSRRSRKKYRKEEL